MLAALHVRSDVNLAEDGFWENIVLDDHLATIGTRKVNPLTGEEIKILDYDAYGITGTGVVAAMAVGLETGAIALPNICNEEGRIKLANGVYFTKDDVREAGKAMGAIRAGHRTLMKEVGVSDDEVRVMYMAGASGTYVDPVKAQYCGMIPRVLDEVYQLGNTSLMMAHDLLSDPETLDRMQSVANSISANHIMFAGNEVFEKMYVLELAYWDEGMSMDMYNDMMEMEGLGRMPDLVPPKKVVRIVKSDIPDVGASVHSMDIVGITLAGIFDGCTGCKSCQRKCPERALTVQDLPDGRHEINVRSDLCLGTACRACEMTNCPERVYRFDLLKGKV
jgi:methylamine methyltransferase corrinoid protein reductive activase